MVEVLCAWCGATVVKKYPSQIRERNYCDKSCLGKFRSEYYTGHMSAHWKGGETKDRDRVLVYRPDHPYARSSGYVYRYRLVAEKMLGRYLLPHEIVHHKDDDESNDDPSNLEVITQAEHASRCDANRGKRRGRWAEKFDSCIVCKETSRKHYGRGMCTRCAQRKENKRASIQSR